MDQAGRQRRRAHRSGLKLPVLLIWQLRFHLTWEHVSLNNDRGLACAHRSRQVYAIGGVPSTWRVPGLAEGPASLAGFQRVSRASAPCHASRQLLSPLAHPTWVGICPGASRRAHWAVSTLAPESARKLGTSANPSAWWLNEWAMKATRLAWDRSASTRESEKSRAVQPANHRSDPCDGDRGFPCFRRSFVIPCPTMLPDRPSKGAFHGPGLGKI